MHMALGALSWGPRATSLRSQHTHSRCSQGRMCAIAGGPPGHPRTGTQRLAQGRHRHTLHTPHAPCYKKIRLFERLTNAILRC